MRGQKTGGRIAGTPNRLTSELRSKLKQVIDTELDRLPELIEGLPPEKRIELLIKLLPFIMPKTEPVSHTFGEPDQWGFV